MITSHQKNLITRYVSGQINEPESCEGLSVKFLSLSKDQIIYRGQVLAHSSIGTNLLRIIDFSPSVSGNITFQVKKDLTKVYEEINNVRIGSNWEELTIGTLVSAGYKCVARLDKDESGWIFTDCIYYGTYYKKHNVDRSFRKATDREASLHALQMCAVREFLNTGESEYVKRSIHNNGIEVKAIYDGEKDSEFERF